MLKVLFIACSSFSGSTLLSFLLNSHPSITTVGHTVGWRYTADEEFHCSCGKTLETCPFWTTVARTFEHKGLPFDFRNFGTRYELAENERLNRYLTARLPIVGSDGLEALRDWIVARVPAWSHDLIRHDRANLALIEAALEYAGSSVYVDNGHSPYRLRQLSRIAELDLFVVHLVRDIRGAVYSHMKNHDWDVGTAARIWLREQSDIVRITRQFGKVTRIFYEDLCDDTEATLAKLYGFVGAPPCPFTGDFGNAEHHILGNVMRFREKQISKDSRWRTELTDKDLETIVTAGTAFARSRGHHPLSDILRHYLGPR